MLHRKTRRSLRSRRPRRCVRRAFTLLEIIVVVTIIAMLAAIVAPRVWGHLGASKRKIAQTEASKIAQEVGLWMLDHGHSTVPDDFELDLLAEGEDRVFNPDKLLDPWENPYVLVVPGEHNPDFDIVSYGADGEPGGEGENEDVHN